MVRRSNTNVEEVPAIPALTDASQNPFYIHPNESATAALVQPLLDGKNYHSWSRSFMKAVIMKNKLRFLNGSCVMPEPFDPTYEPWIRCNNLVLSWLMNSVISTISQSLVYTETASQAWDDLKARFSRTDRVCISSLQRDLYALRQDSLSVTEFFTKLKGIWEELELYRPIPNCSCTFQCVCEAMRNAKKFREEDLVLLFLTGLNDHYGMVRSQILLMDHFPQLNSVFGMIIQHESLNGLDQIEDQTISGSINFARKPSSYGKYPPKTDKLCTYCHKTNHVVENCYKKHGFPPGFRFRDGTVAGSKHNGQASTNCVDAEDQDQEHTSDKRVVAFFSSEEYQALMALLKSNSRSAGESSSSQVNSFSKCFPSSASNDKQGNGFIQWILDNGATDHASRQWYAKLSQFLVTIGYSQKIADPTLFTKSDNSNFTALLVYVDDIVLTGNCLEEITVTKRKLHEAFGIKDIGVLKFFLGLEVAHSEQGITLCQRKYCLDLLSETGNLGCKPSSIPMDPSHRLHHDDSTPHENITEYRALVGKLLYLTSTRPDIAFPVQQLSQFLDAPTSLHFKAAHKVLRYLKGNPGTGLFFPRNSSLQLSGFSDADWGGCPDSRKSITGYCFFIGQSLICWKSKKQLTVSKSSSEAEYRALASATCELQWLNYLLTDLQVQTTKLPTLYCDSQSALHIASNPVFHERTKHIDIDCHIVREKLQAGLMKLSSISGYNQTADIFTKALHPANFHRLFVKLGLLNIFQAST
ncbi:hypothetical protein TSUD_274860 [Trifolium subterraneum]|uniref:Reverse transcriptase Ty1/copia-type domain-containing protein n=1 Tax=Trifolium subterraneum TaxID=3900 RepID=A0A2Z6MRK3_TRISU|nr:hypothetical protein TSUD_274860 [Trifolium subterraneum]